MAINKTSVSFSFVRRPQSTGGRELSAEASWTPSTDVYLTQSGLVMKVELAGMRREDLELMVEGNLLRISGYRRDCCREPGCRFVLMEINYGHFESLIEVPPGYDLSNAKAAYQNGFLRVDVPHQPIPPPQPFSVPVTEQDT
jgi:HSP20 family protein